MNTEAVGNTVTLASLSGQIEALFNQNEDLKRKLEQISQKTDTNANTVNSIEVQYC